MGGRNRVGWRADGRRVKEIKEEKKKTTVMELDESIDGILPADLQRVSSQQGGSASIQDARFLGATFRSARPHL